MHDGMDTTNVLIFTRSQAGVRVGIVREHHARVKRAGVAVLEATDVRNGVFGRSRIFPSDRCTGGRGR